VVEHLVTMLETLHFILSTAKKKEKEKSKKKQFIH
jgi:hypothetical protein